MSSTAMNIARMVDMLPENDQLFAQEFIRKLGLVLKIKVAQEAKIM